MDSITQKVDFLFSDYDHLDSPGCALAVIRDSAIIYKRGYGMANLEYAILVTPQTIFHVASVSKQFTAMAVVMLACSGKLGLDDEVRKYIPELPDFGYKITISQLLHHTSGLRDQWELAVMAGWRMDDVISTEDVLDLLQKQRQLNFPPGTEFLYSNTGYTLLGLIVERLSGKSLRQFCSENLFVPLGMNRTLFHDDHNELVPGRAYSYAPKEGGGFQHSVLSYATVGATSLFTTVEDLALWDAEFYTGKVTGMPAITLMHEQGVLNDGEKIAYAFGINVSQYRGLNIVEHSGGDAGFRSHLIRFPDEHFSVVILSNLSTIRPGNLARKVADLYLADAFNQKGLPLEQPDEAYIHSLTPLDLQRFAGIYYNSHTNESQRLEMRMDKLVLAQSPGFEILPISRGRFSLAEAPEYELRFDEPQNGEVNEVRIYAGSSHPVSYIKITPPSGVEQLWEDYTGSYFSPELQAAYQIENQDGHLGVRRRKYGFTPLYPSVPDGFASEEMNILFERNADHLVSGFKVTAGRVRNLSFMRLPNP